MDQIVKDKTCIFLVSTLYHLLVTVIIQKKYHIENHSVIYAQNISEDLLDICEKINNSKMMTLSFVRSKWRIGYFFSTIRDRSLFSSFYSKSEKPILLFNFRWNLDHVFYDASTAYRKSNEIVLVEDGPNCYVNYSGSKVYKLFKKCLGAIFDFCEDEKVLRIYVSDPSKYPNKFKNKIDKLDVKSMWDTLLDEDQNLILQLFCDELLIQKLYRMNNIGIIYTQPLSEDGFVTETEKKKMFMKMCEYYSQYGNIILKVHPRDGTDYSDIGYAVLPNNWPSELLQLLGVHLKFAIGICTSAVLTTDADIKININDNFLKDKVFKLIPIQI